MLTGKDYPHLCKECRDKIDEIALLAEFDDEAIEDDEAACDYVYDHKLFCGGFTCVNKLGETND